MALAAEASSTALVAADEAAAVGWRGLLGLVGFVLGALAFLAIDFHRSGTKAKSFAIGVDAFTAALKKDNGALGTNTRAAVANQLAKDGAFKAANKLGIGTDVLTDAVLEGGTAMSSLKAQLTAASAALTLTQASVKGFGGTTADVQTATDKFTTANGDAAVSAQNLLNELTGVSGGLIDARQNADNMSTALGTGSSTVDQQKAAIDQFVQNGAAVNKTGVPFQQAVNRGDLSSAAGILAAKGYGGGTVDLSPVVAELREVNGGLGAVERAVYEGSSHVADRNDGALRDQARTVALMQTSAARQTTGFGA